MFLLQPNGAGSLDLDAIRDHLESIGESVLVAGDARALKVHVHNERPDLVVGYGLSLGTISRISIENLDNQARDVRETRAAAFTSDVAEPRARAGGDAATASAGSNGRPARAAEIPALGVVSVVAGDGLAAIFRDFGVAAVVQGGQSAHPSTGELLAAVKALAPGFELLTLFYGDGADLDEAETMARRIGATLPGVEVEVRHGGQPFYRYLISAE